MKITVVIADPLFSRAKKLAAAQKTTLKTLINQGLAKELASLEKKPTFKLKDASFGKGGLRDEIKHLSMRDIIAMANDRAHDRD